MVSPGLLMALPEFKVPWFARVVVSTDALLELVLAGTLLESKTCALLELVLTGALLGPMYVGDVPRPTNSFNSCSHALFLRSPCVGLNGSCRSV